MIAERVSQDEKRGREAGWREWITPLQKALDHVVSSPEDAVRWIVNMVTRCRAERDLEWRRILLKTLGIGAEKLGPMWLADDAPSSPEDFARQMDRVLGRAFEQGRAAAVKVTRAEIIAERDAEWRKAIWPDLHDSSMLGPSQAGRDVMELRDRNELLKQRLDAIRDVVRN